LVSDQPVHGLEAPAAGDELRREPVEQLRMRRLGAVDAEVAGRVHEAGAEVVVPDAICHYAGRQRILHGRQPFP